MKEEKVKEIKFAFRVDETLRDEFLNACRCNDDTGGRVLRKFMREYVASKEKERGNDDQ